MGMIFLNGKEYTSSPKDGFPPMIYSDEEREIGVWKDGKPLYQKTIIGSMSAAQTASETDLTSLNIDTFVGIDSGGTYAIRAVGGTTGDLVYTMNMNEPDSSAMGWRARYQYANKKLAVYARDFKAAPYCVTIRYTKTTDVAGSGKYTTYGGLSHHYSESEQVVGTWIDGKPLYEKTVSGTSITRGTTYNVAHSISNISEIVNSDVNCHFSNNGAWRKLNFAYNNGSTDANWYAGYTVDNTNISFQVGNSFQPVDKWHATIRYTKTTD